MQETRKTRVCRAEWVRVGVAAAGSMLRVACVRVPVLRVLEVGLRERALVGGQQRGVAQHRLVDQRLRLSQLRRPLLDMRQLVQQ